ncbi:MAG TPA: thioredoxin domain-containing protein [Candidatus Nanoarchaeia archaeon]|nr:thioredoxin domain-containing protein [Candidatus Nanoarchaeia archaeon]
MNSDKLAMAGAGFLLVAVLGLVSSLDFLFPAPPLDLASLRVNATLLESLASDAPVTLLVFTDYGCGPCKSLYSVLERIKGGYGENVAIITKFMPSKDGKLETGLAAECGNDAFRMYLYLGQGKDPLAYAEMAGLGNETVLDCMRNTSTQDKVLEGIELGTKLGVTGLPTLFMNGVAVEGAASYSELKLLIDSELQ